MTDSNALRDSLLSWRDFYGSCSALLIHRDRWLDQQPPHLRGVVGKSCLAGESSASIDKPVGWLPDVICRVYQHNSRPEIFAWLAVMLLMRESKVGWSDRDQPLVSAGWARMNEPPPSDGYKLVGISRVLWANPSVPIDGRLHDASWQDKKYTFGTVRVAGVPLAQVASSEHLEDRVLRPLTADLLTLEDA